jgi:hypothetical protein
VALYLAPGDVDASRTLSPGVIPATATPELIAVDYSLFEGFESLLRQQQLSFLSAECVVWNNGFGPCAQFVPNPENRVLEPRRSFPC